MQPPFTVEERNFILKRYFKEYSFRSYNEFMTQKGKMPQLEQQYMERVPILPLSRCPFCHTVNFLSIDHYDVDGLWWNSNHRPERPRERESRCPHYYTLSGALRLAETINYPPFQVTTGPEVPFVVAAFLRRLECVKVVISQLTIGLHTGYPIVYYMDNMSNEDGIRFAPYRYPYIPLFPEWGNNIAVFFNQGYQYNDSESVSGCYLNRYFLPYHFSGEYDESCFDLAHWIQQGRVYWIAPNDESLTLHNDIEGCPYLNLPGRREVALLSRGKVYWDSSRYSDE